MIKLILSIQILMKINSIGGINFLDRPEKDESLIYDNK